MVGKEELRRKIEQFALVVRTQLNLSSPLNMFEVMNKLGIEVNSVENVEYDAKISEKNGDFCIDYDKNQIFERQQFSIAHELGHLLLHKFNENEYQDIVYYRRNGNRSRIEWEANEFAASFLMPRREFIEFCLNNADDAGKISLKTIAKKFKVSMQAVRVRGSALGLW